VGVAHSLSLVTSCTNNRINGCTNDRIDRCRRCTLPVAAAAIPVAATAIPATAAAIPATAAAIPATAAFAEFVNLIIKLGFFHGLHLIIKLVINGHLVGTHKGDWARLADSTITAEIVLATGALGKVGVAHSLSLVTSCTNNRINGCTNDRIDRCRRCTLPVAAAAIPVAATAIPATAAAIPATAAAIPATAAFAEFVNLIIKLGFFHGLHLIIKLVINGHLVGTHKGDWARLTDSIVTAEVFFGTIILDKMRVAHCCSLVSSCTNNRIDRCRRCTNNRIDRCRRCTLPVAAAALPVAAAALPATATSLPATATSLPATATAIPASLAKLLIALPT